MSDPISRYKAAKNEYFAACRELFDALDGGSDPAGIPSDYHSLAARLFEIAPETIAVILRHRDDPDA